MGRRNPRARDNRVCRFLCQNVNGISNTNHLSKAHEIGEAARDFGVNILGLIETNISLRALKSAVLFI